VQVAFRAGSKVATIRTNVTVENCCLAPFEMVVHAGNDDKRPIRLGTAGDAGEAGGAFR
jgi:hypothetical protein